MYLFHNERQASSILRNYHQKLEAIARDRQQQDRMISDRDYPTEVLILRPQQTQGLPLVLLGGMGPIAGLEGFKQAIALCGNSREIILFQACFLPDRTIPIQQNSNSLKCELIMLLKIAIERAVKMVSSPHQPIDIIVLCNSAHYFLHRVWKQLKEHSPTIAQQLQHYSLVESTCQYLQEQNLRYPLILGTEGVRLGKVYSQPLESRGIAYSEPNQLLQNALMDCIYCGVKALNRELACELGKQLLPKLLSNQGNIDCIIAGCTEIVYLLQWIKEDGDREMIKMINSLNVIDPVNLALQRTIKENQPKKL
ncbi:MULTISPECIES: aspartate/glutamate racemase family protein [Spirulina sp. CCY15215]|uniref:aspartate/glutamate racemase family protein n=1 Tax=Spirulina sp. CCY15215 TaxID=2767591 RepID=UPI00194DD972|nr:aspartate/glutamate racemase family protein [Spirulina major]